MSEEIFPYEVSKIRLKELNLLTKHELENMADETDINKIISILIEKRYVFDTIDKIEDFEIVLKKKTEKLYNLIKELIPNTKFANIFLCKNDYHNLKLILKANIIGKDYKDYLIDLGTIEVSKIESAIENKDYSVFSEQMRQGVQMIFDTPEYMNNPYIIDCILDAKNYEEMLSISRKTKSDFIIKYVKRVINLTNIKTFFRIFRKFNRDKKIFDLAYIEGGSIRKNVFMESFSQDLQNSKLKSEVYKEIYDEALYNPETFDKFCDNYIMSYMKEAKLKALTIEPIVAYIYGKETEIKNIRILFTGKVNNISPQIIKERFRESYV